MDEHKKIMEDAIRNTKPPVIVRSVGDLKKVEVEGKAFHRQKTIPMYMNGTDKPPLLVKCADYDNHFIFKDVRHLGWVTFCTCGAPAVVVGYDAYKRDASQQGSLLVCLTHSQTNKHADGSS